MRYDNNELILNHITTGELMLTDRRGPEGSKEFDKYSHMAYLFLNYKGKHLFADEIIKNFGHNGITIDEIFAQNPQRYVKGAVNQMRNGKMEKTWYDIWAVEEIEGTDEFFDYFFSCKLRHISLLGIDELLDFHLERSFKSDRQKFHRFLEVLITQYKTRLLNQDIIDTINGWIKLSKADTSNNELEEKELGIKGTSERTRKDNKTSLSEAQTVLLVKFMREMNIIKSDKDLNYTQTAKAFDALTGYSYDSLRQYLGKKGEVIEPKHEDYIELHQVILDMAKLIEAKIRKK